MEQTISKFPNPFGSVAPHKLFAWGLSATVGYGFAIWGVRIYQNQTVELGGQLLVVLMQAFVLPALLYGADRLRRRLPADATALFGGLLFAQIPRLAASAGSAWLYAWLLPLGNGSVSPLQETKPSRCRAATARFRRCKRRCGREVRPFWAASPFCAAFGA